VKVLIAANSPTLDSPVAKRFGHAPYYLVVNTATMQMQAIDNNDQHDETDNHGQHDESHAIIPHMVAQGVEIFITGNIGPHAFELIRSLDRRVALARRMSAGEALNRLQRGELEILSVPTLKRSVHNHTHHSA
jgi:predicted Fe-Mo cluster-binding NifX family protein